MKLSFRRDRAEWVKVLEKMYEKQLSTTLDEIHNDQRKSKYENPEQADRLEKYAVLNQELHDDIGAESIRESVQYLKTVGLVDEIGPKRDGEYDFGDSTLPFKGTFRLNMEGFQLAHQIKTERQRRKTNRRLLHLTSFITVLTAFLIAIEFIEVPILYSL